MVFLLAFAAATYKKPASEEDEGYPNIKPTIKMTNLRAG
jgi:hypothetical protein